MTSGSRVVPCGEVGPGAVQQSERGPILFEPLGVRGVTLRNRIMMSPMCQHSATAAGVATPWHLVHYGSRAVGGVGLIMMEDCAVEPRGRLSRAALGLYDDAQVEPLHRIVEFCHGEGASVGIQLAHAGRKAFGPALGQHDESILAPSPLPFGEGWAVPRAMEDDDFDRITAAFAAAAGRAVAAGFDLVEVHAAHGYLLHEFLSPLTNRRTDRYGGSAENNRRFVHDVLAAVRDACPSDMPVFIRVSASDLEPGGLTVDDTVGIVRSFDELVDVVDVSAGGLTASPIGAHTADQPGMAAQIRRATGKFTIAVGSVTDAASAERLLEEGAGDIVGVGRALLRNPYWTLQAAAELGVDVLWPRQYALAKK